MFKAVTAVALGLLAGGTAYVLAAPGDGASTSADPAGVPIAGVTTVELPAPVKHEHHHREARVQTKHVSQVDAASHQLVDTSPSESQGSRGPSPKASHPPQAPDRTRNAGRVGQGSSPGSDDAGSDDQGEDESGESGSHDSGSDRAESGDSDSGG